eukprot:3940720-Rhodomonas_salina.2
MSGTELVYAATRSLRAAAQRCTRCLSWPPRAGPPKATVRTRYAPTAPTPVPLHPERQYKTFSTICTEIAYGPHACDAISGTEIWYGAMQCPVLCGVRYCDSVWCYAMSGTKIGHGAMQCPVLRQRMVLCGVRYCDSAWCYAMSGTEIAYGAMRCP